MKFNDFTESVLSLRYASTSSPIWLQLYYCRPYSHLRVCGHRGVGIHYCGHTHDAILSCLVEGSVRLLASSNSSESTVFFSLGRLEVYVNNVWGTVCDNGFTMNSANVVCQQLGFSAAERWTNTEAER